MMNSIVGRVMRGRRNQGFGLLTLMTVLLIAGNCSTDRDGFGENGGRSAESPPVAGMEARVSINDVMVSWINPASYAVWDAARESLAPKNEADWTKLENDSVQLVAAASWITVGGVGANDSEWIQQPGWLAYSEQMADAAEAGLTAARNQDLDAYIEAGNQLVETCEGCHRDFRPVPEY